VQDLQECREETSPADVADLDVTADIRQILQGRGCDACNNTGYKGRVGLFELMIMNDDGATCQATLRRMPTPPAERHGAADREPPLAGHPQEDSETILEA
jgi:hypothetical protein